MPCYSWLLATSSNALVTSSDALVTSSNALVTVLIQILWTYAMLKHGQTFIALFLSCILG